MPHTAAHYHDELAAFLNRLRGIASAKPLTRAFAFLVRCASDIHRDLRDAHRREHQEIYATLMLAESDAKAAQRELAASRAKYLEQAQQTAHELEAVALPPELEAADAHLSKLLERIYAAKGIVALFVVCCLLHAELSPLVDDPERRRPTRVLRVTPRKIEEAA